MAAFYWNWKLYTLAAGKTISNVCNDLASKSAGGIPTFPTLPPPTGVGNDSQTAHAQVGTFRLAVLCLPTTGSEFWMVVAVSGDGGSSEAQSILDISVVQIGIQANGYWGKS